MPGLHLSNYLLTVGGTYLCSLNTYNVKMVKDPLRLKKTNQEKQ